MGEEQDIFEQHYKDYCEQIGGLDLDKIAGILGIGHEDGRALVQFYDQMYRVSKDGVQDENRERPTYPVCVVLCKYLLLCPKRVYEDPEWAAVTDLTGQFTNINFFQSVTIKPLVEGFSGRLEDLARAGRTLGGEPLASEVSYDLALSFKALPRLSLALLFNDGDEEFPPQAMVLFQRQGQHYLDPESLGIISAILSKRLCAYGS